jgi:hypothetical protein
MKRSIHNQNRAKKRAKKRAKNDPGKSEKRRRLIGFCPIGKHNASDECEFGAS